MKFFLAFILLTSQMVTTETDLHRKLQDLYTAGAFRWKIAAQYFEMAQYYSQNRMADKAFIMLVQAHNYGYNHYSEVKTHPAFHSLRQLKYWQYYYQINRPSLHYSMRGYYKQQNSHQKFVLHPKIIQILLQERTHPHYQTLLRKYKNTILIQAYSTGEISLYEISYRFEESKGNFTRFKLEQFAPSGDIIFELNIPKQKSIFYFYYRDKSWAVQYQEKNGVINWELL